MIKVGLVLNIVFIILTYLVPIGFKLSFQENKIIFILNATPLIVYTLYLVYIAFKSKEYQEIAYLLIFMGYYSIIYSIKVLRRKDC